MKKILALAACLALPTFANAKTTTFQCLVKGQHGGWIAEQVFFEFDDELSSARVSDGIILHFEGKPLAAEVTEDSAKKLVINWRVVTKSRSQTTKMSYRLSYLRSTGRVVVSAKPHGFTNNFTARGRCQRINQALPTT